MRVKKIWFLKSSLTENVVFRSSSCWIDFTVMKTEANMRYLRGGLVSV